MARPFKGGVKYPRELYGSPLYKTWGDMKTRCNNPRWKQYADYGGRGIRVCGRWDSFANFAEDMGGSWSPGMTLDRIDTNGDYTPENCRWLTRSEQQKNRRNSRVIEHQGARRTLREWADALGIKHSTLKGRYYTQPIETRSLARCLEV